MTMDLLLLSSHDTSRTPARLEDEFVEFVFDAVPYPWVNKMRHPSPSGEQLLSKLNV